jgi:hypothetical protein
MTENGSYRGSFATAQGHYLYGQRAGDFIVMNEGGVIESLPEEEHASALAAWAIAPQPVAQRVLIIGAAGLAIGRRLHVLPQVKEVVWLTPDPECTQRVLAVLPMALRKTYEPLTAKRILSLIRQNKLADQPARFYTPAIDANLQVETPEKQ